MFKFVKFAKDFLLYSGLLRIFSPLGKTFLFLYNFNTLQKWIYSHRKGLLVNDFYSSKRDYGKRKVIYETVSDHYQLAEKPILYYEFGVAQAHSFRWWLANNTHADSRFYGFDTFEGLPEDWGTFFQKGDMSAGIPDTGDARASFVKGIFQDTLCDFIVAHKEELAGQKIIHLDADLFSATIFTLSQLYPYLKAGDIILFDEFNVANHEFQAFKIFTESFYFKMRPIAAQNNFYQVAFIVE